MQYRLFDLKWDDVNYVNAKEKEPLLTVCSMEQFLPQRTKKKVDTATSQQQEHGTSELQLATCGTSLVTTVQLVTDGEPPSPNIVQQQPTIAMEITQPSCADSDTDNITTQSGTAAFQLSAEPSSSRHCTECNTVTEEVELKPTDIGEIYYVSKSSHDFCVALKSLSTAERYTLLKHNKQPSSSYIYPVTLIGKYRRRFRQSWLNQYRWIVYSNKCDGVFCALLGDNHSRATTFTLYSF